MHVGVRSQWVVLRAATGDESYSSVMNRGGKMKLLLRSLLLCSLCAPSSWSSVSSENIYVTQSPDVSFQEGETGNITCCWNGTTKRVGINWIKNQTVIQNKTFINQSTGSQNEQENYCSVLTFEKIKWNDSARYICKITVEIPTLDSKEGNGTTVSVRTKENKTKSTAPDNLSNSEKSAKLPVHMIVAVAVGVSLAITVLLCFCTIRKKQGQAVRVIYEVPHTDSLDAEMDKHSTSSSRGSSQWCDVVVYDSVNYFEGTEVKKDSK